VALDRSRTPAANIRAVIINSGNANACTGERGMRDAEQMAAAAAQACGAKDTEALVLSTGIIGAFLPMEKIATEPPGGSLHPDHRSYRNGP
jgi:glutamate N-acetyltransferase/amino-acid N-acetyltransferase